MGAVTGADAATRIGEAERDAVVEAGGGVSSDVVRSSVLVVLRCSAEVAASVEAEVEVMGLRGVVVVETMG